jgi:hypothetical protein
MIAIASVTRSDFIHIASESSIHIAGIRTRAPTFGTKDAGAAVHCT